MARQKMVFVSKDFAKNKCQPVYLADVCAYLSYVMKDQRTYGKVYDICGPEIMTYKEIIERYLDVVKLRKKIMTLPALGSTISMFMVRYVYRFEQDIFAAFRVNMRKNLICKKNGLKELYPFTLTPFRKAVPLALGLLETTEPPARK